MTDINFLRLEDILKMHAIQIETYGGSDGLRGGGRALLEAAIAQPQQTWDGELLYTSVFEMAAVYAYHIAESQAFVDGSKRTGLQAAIVFLHINGYPLPNSDERLYDAMIGIANKIFTKEELADLFRELYVAAITGPK